MALALVRDAGWNDDLLAALQDARRRVACCSLCGSITTTEENPCRLCTDPAREVRVLCVVEQPHDIMLLERSGDFHGRYHALMGKLSPGRGEGPASLRVQALLDRLDKKDFDEVILALSTDTEGEMTAGFLAEQMHGRGIKTTRLAFGLPAGSAVMYSDPVTLGRAIRGRQPV
jgi:recombination protein RecR